MKITKDSAGYYVDAKVRKPCPFCGGKAIITTLEELGEESSNCYHAGEQIYCMSCKVGFQKHHFEEDYGYFDSEEAKRERMLECRRLLLSKWNKRV